MGVLWGCSDGLGPRFLFTSREGWPKHSAGTNFPYFEVKGQEEGYF